MHDETVGMAAGSRHAEIASCRDTGRCGGLTPKALMLRAAAFRKCRLEERICLSTCVEVAALAGFGLAELANELHQPEAMI
jgi:hypothetical protein